MSKCKYHGDLPYKVRGCESCEGEPPVAGSATGSAASVNYNLDTRIFTNGIIEMELRNATETLSRWVMNTRDEATRKALIALGWTPPNNQALRPADEK